MSEGDGQDEPEDGALNRRDSSVDMLISFYIQSQTNSVFYSTDV